MTSSYILLANLYLLCSSYNIIRDLPYNIYHVEDMNQYENKYLPEGNKFYIRFPSDLNNDIKFYLTIPKNTSLFPIYASEFSKYPSDKEIMDTNFKNEIELKNREDLYYSIYTYDIKKSDPYKVLYFQNNEILNYISFYASSNNTLGSSYSFQNLSFSDRTYLYDFLKGDYYFKLKANYIDSNIKIETRVKSGYRPEYTVDIKLFAYDPADKEITYIDNTWERNIPYDLSIDSSYENRNYEIKPNRNYVCVAIHIYNEKDLDSSDQFSILVTTYKELSFLSYVIIIGVAIAMGVGLVFCLRTETGRNLCACLTAITCCVAIMGVNAANAASRN